MRIAVAYENGQVFQHFGQTKQFQLYEIQSGRVLSSMNIGAPCTGHEELAAFLSQLRAQAVICGGIGGGARAALEEAGILLYGGVTGSADEAAAALAAGTLQFDPEIHCHSHEEGHSCAEHGCGHDCSHCSEETH